MRKCILAILIASLLLAGCNFPSRFSMTNQTPLPLGYSSGGPTPTPFQPMNTTPGSGEEQQSGGTATETQPAPTPTPYADLGFELPKSMINILLLGSDRRADNSFRTDVIMMLSLDPEKGTASLISFPRDLSVHSRGGNGKGQHITGIRWFPTHPGDIQVEFWGQTGLLHVD